MKRKLLWKCQRETFAQMRCFRLTLYCRWYDPYGSSTFDHFLPAQLNFMFDTTPPPPPWKNHLIPPLSPHSASMKASFCFPLFPFLLLENPKCFLRFMREILMRFPLASLGEFGFASDSRYGFRFGITFPLDDIVYAFLRSKTELYLHKS